MPRVVAVGGAQRINGATGALTTLATAVSLDLATLAWGGGGTVPDLPGPCRAFSLGQLPGGRLVVAGGSAGYGGRNRTAFEWLPGRVAWTPLPPMGTARAFGAAAVLSDGRLLVAGGHGGSHSLASVEVLAADSSGWSALPPMAAARYDAVVGRLPGGQVIVAGGADDDIRALASVELWDPVTGAWAVLPPMAHPRRFATGCGLPSGRFVVLGGIDIHHADRGDAEAFDPVRRVWELLPPMPRVLLVGAAVAVAGGLLAVGGENHAGAMLFDEESGRWFTLPGQMPAGRAGHGLTTVPGP
jgi:hypothetical protein